MTALVVAGVLVTGTCAPSWASSADQPSAPPAPGPAHDPVSAGKAADAYLASHPAAVHKGDDDVLVRGGVLSGTRGMTYVVYERTYRGLPVVGGDAVVTVAPGNTVTGVSAAQKRPLTTTTTRPLRSAQDAVTTARSDTTYGPVSATSSPRLAILAWPQSPVLAWEIIVTEQMSGIPVEQQVYVDATTGGLIATSEGGTVKITTASSGDAFRLADPTRPGLSCAGPGRTGSSTPARSTRGAPAEATTSSPPVST
ncbi:MAG: hypothetical protein QG671_535 [Actinomycetota bacterium]|nr:hypothetical protein [Actinomycetota bacterium]